MQYFEKYWLFKKRNFGGKGKNKRDDRGREREKRADITKKAQKIQHYSQVYKGKKKIGKMACGLLNHLMKDKAGRPCTGYEKKNEGVWVWKKK